MGGEASESVLSLRPSKACAEKECAMPVVAICELVECPLLPTPRRAQEEGGHWPRAGAIRTTRWRATAPGDSRLFHKKSTSCHCPPLARLEMEGASQENPSPSDDVQPPPPPDLQIEVRDAKPATPVQVQSGAAAGEESSERIGKFVAPVCLGLATAAISFHVALKEEADAGRLPLVYARTVVHYLILGVAVGLPIFSILGPKDDPGVVCIQKWGMVAGLGLLTVAYSLPNYVLMCAWLFFTGAVIFSTLRLARKEQPLIAPPRSQSNQAARI